jgi:sulfite reductase (ferredoxin)
MSGENSTPETKTQRVERLKRNKNAWEALAELCEYARQGFHAIPPEWLGTYLRWWGVYTQGDGAGVVGGSGGEGKAVPYFMVRIRIPNGLLTAVQLRVIGELSRQYARRTADITVRQNIQLHWVAAEALPDVLHALQRAGLTSMGACGDVTRNVTGCPLSGIDAEEICDASPLAMAVNRRLAGNPEFYNLPRKFKISISGCRDWCSYPEINDIGLTAVRRAADGAIGFSLRVGGGLSTEPHLAVRLNAFVRWEQVEDVVAGIASFFRDEDSLRQNRERARLKFLFLRERWTTETFQRELERRIGVGLDPAEPERPPDDVYRDHVGVHAQKQAGFSYAGLAVLRGRLTPEQILRVAELAEEFGSGQVRTTNMQNLLITNVRNEHVPELAAELARAGLPVSGSPFWRGAIACSGTEFCKLALTETKSFTRWLVEELEARVPEFDQPLKVHVTGCPNSCGQHWIADIGIEGKKIKTNGRMVDAYYFCLGGAVGLHARIARPVGYRCAAEDVPEAIERLLREYLKERYQGENLRHFFGRRSNEELRTILAGAAVIPVERDASIRGAAPAEF